MKENIIKNYSIEEYNKKYANRRDRLTKYTKKEVEIFRKENNYSLLKGHKWALIGDTYYQIPKPFTFTWFRNLNRKTKICAGIFLGAACVTAIAVPLSFIRIQPYVSIDSNLLNRCEIIYHKTNVYGDRELLLQTKGERNEFIEELTIKIGDDTLLDDEYEFNIVTNNDKSMKMNIVIYKNTLDSHKGKVVITPKFKVRLMIPGGDLNLTLGQDPVQLKAIDEDTGDDVTDKVFFIESSPIGETCGIDVDAEGLITPVRVGGGNISVFSDASLYVPYTIKAKVVADPTKGNRTLTLEAGVGGRVYNAGSYPYYTLVTAVAIPSSSYRFVHWVNSSEVEISSNKNYQFHLSEDTYLKAIFEHNLDYFKPIYEKYFKEFDNSSSCPYTSCNYNDNITGKVIKSCTLNYNTTASPKQCEVKNGDDVIAIVAGGQYTYSTFIDELEDKRSTHTFECDVDINSNITLKIYDSNKLLEKYYTFNSNGYLTHYTSSSSTSNDPISFSIKYNK